MPPFPPSLLVSLILLIFSSLFLLYVGVACFPVRVQFGILDFELISPSSQSLGLAAILISSSFPGSPISLAFS